MTLAHSLFRHLVLASLCLLWTDAVRADEFDDLRLRWRDMLTGGTNLDLGDTLVKSRLSSIAGAANSSWATLNTNAGRTNLWSDAARLDQSEDITTCYSRLRAMALAWSTRGCSLQGNATLASDIVSGLDWVYTNRYNEAKTEYDNWWDWEIGAPQNLNNTAVLMYDRLTASQLANYCKAVDKFVPATTYTGANRSDTALVVAIRGILGRDAARLVNARDGLSPLFPYVTSGDGFYTDGSFIQHGKHPYTGSYGSVLIDGVSRLMWLLSASTWQVTDPARSNVYRWVYDSYEPAIYKGATLDNLRGRAISRLGSTDHSAGAGNMSSILQIAQFAPPNDAAAFKQMLKYWIQADTYRNFTNNVPLNLMPQTRALMADSNVLPRGELIGHYQFPCMDRVVHLRPGFGLAIGMSSSRIYTYECINTENLHGWFTGDGQTALYNNDLGQFSDNFWATVDPYHLPGTTVDLTNRTDASGQSATTGQNWVGGASLTTNFGIAGMALDAQVSTLVAQKSWFMFDNEIVCLGAGITCAGTNAIHTTVENRRLAASATNGFSADGAAMPTTLGWSSNFAALSWCSLARAGGYYFPGGASVNARREVRTNTWYEINKLSQPTASLTNPVSENFLTLWFNHGVKPTNATYAYTLLPNLTASQVAAYAAAPEIAVVANNTNVQAVREGTLGIVAANFWKSGTNSADLITVNNKASVITREAGNLIEVALSDPTQTNTGSIVVTLDRPAYWVVSADAGVTVQQLTPQIRLAVSVNGARGRSLRALFSSDATNPNPTWDANPGANGAQDGSGSWNGVALNWWNNVTNVVWNDAASPIATFGAGGTGGTVTLPGARSAGALVFNPLSAGRYTLTGPGPLSIRSGITASSSATLEVPLVLTSDQVWTVSTGQTLVVSTALATLSPIALTVGGAGALDLSGGSDTLSGNLARLRFAGNVPLSLGPGAQGASELTLDDNISTVISGTGSLTVAGASDLRIGGTISGGVQSLDLSGLAAFTYSAPGRTFGIGGQSSTVAGTGMVWLATNSTIVASTLGVQQVTGSTAAQSTGALYLGRQTTIHCDAIVLGLTRDNGMIRCAPGTASPLLNLRGSDGISRVGAVTVGNRGSSYFATNTALVDLVTGVTGASVLDARIGRLTIGDEAYCLTTSRQLNGTFLMGRGTLDATNIVVGVKSSASAQSLGIVNAAFFQTNGGTVLAATLTLGDVVSGNSGTLNAAYHLGGGGTLRAGVVQSGAGAASRTFDWSDGTLRNYDPATSLTIGSGLTLTLAGGGVHTLETDANCTSAISAVLAGSGGLTKAGEGVAILAVSNSFTGNTVIAAGTLVLGSAGSVAASPSIVLAGGAVLDVAGVSGGYTLGPTQTLSGDGNVAGNVTVAGTLAPGAGLGTLTFSTNLLLNGKTVMELTRTNGVVRSDQVAVLGALTYGGSLVVTNIGTNALQVGDSLRLFTAGTRAGSFASSSLPPLAPPLFWTNRLALDGSLSVAAPANPVPTNLVAVLADHALTLTWPADHIGWRLETQTNALATGLGTNWSTWPGSTTTNAITVPVNPGDPTVFFRLGFP